MIVDPDFFDHWRTRMVVDALGGDEMAPIYIMRLWAHCQNRKGDTFAIPCAGIKALCKYAGDADVFEKALIDAEFLRRDGDSVTVEGWAERNASLLAAWENGGKGGRPKKPSKNPRETHGKPNGNPAVTQREPDANPRETDKSREEKSNSVPDGTGGEPPGLSPKDYVFSQGVPMLVAAGCSDKNARSMLAGLLKASGDAAVAKAVAECATEQPIQPVSWLQARLKTKPGARAGAHSGFNQMDYTKGVHEDGTLV